jgi:hypothetical protein
LFNNWRWRFVNNCSSFDSIILGERGCTCWEGVGRPMNKTFVNSWSELLWLLSDDERFDKRRLDDKCCSSLFLSFLGLLGKIICPRRIRLHIFCWCCFSRCNWLVSCAINVERCSSSILSSRCLSYSVCNANACFRLLTIIRFS